MAGASPVFTPWSSTRLIVSNKDRPSWWPEEDQDRIASYDKYDQLYWNDPTQYVLRVLDQEQPLYIPSARKIVDTTSHYYLKGLELKIPTPEKNQELKLALDSFVRRERFMSRFGTAKHSGVARGDYAMHMTADPDKDPGTRLSLTDLDPATVRIVVDEDDREKVLEVQIVNEIFLPEEPGKLRVHLLRYWYTWSNADAQTGTRTVNRSEGIYEIGDQKEEKWWTEGRVQVQSLLNDEELDARINTIPVYWFRNMDWQGQSYGSSELRGLEMLALAISQGATDTQAALSLEGLGVYATDGGRPVSDDGVETDWEVAPGRVMEVPSGSYFRRVEGVGSVKPMQDQIAYVEKSMEDAAALSDVALGKVDVQTAQSGIALAIKFQPTLAKIEERDTAGLETLDQMFFDWRVWMQVYEGQTFEGPEQQITPEIGEKLPADRTERVNELNNMFDRSIISVKYYRQEMQALGYEFPDDIDAQIDEDNQKKVALAVASAPPTLQPNAAAAASGTKPPPANGGVAQGSQNSRAQNRSNNKNRVNESSGTESGQSLTRQTRGGTSRK